MTASDWGRAAQDAISPPTRSWNLHPDVGIDPFTPAWLNRDPHAVRMLPRAFDDAEARRAAVDRARSRTANAAVLQSLTMRSDAQRRHAEVLSQGDAVAVVTGQQAGLFGGPLYTVYKAAAAIRNAAALQAETGVPAVPVFWLQDEDHDFDEIATCHVWAHDHDLVSIRVEERPPWRGRSVWARPWGDRIGPALTQLDEALQGLPHHEDTMALFRACYTSEHAPSGSLRELVHALFAEHGLLVVDPCHRELAAAAQPVHDRAFADAEPIAAALTARVGELQQAGFRVQVHVRPRAPLSFVHPDGADGPRFRVEPAEPGRMRLCGTPRTMAVEQVAPLPRSTSALLRPLLQDTWLPTACYVGGPGEIAYFAQLPPLYAHMGVPMPLLALRARFRIHDEAGDKLLAQMKLTAEDLHRSDDDLMLALGTAGAGQSDPDALFDALHRDVDARLAAFEPEAKALEPGLGKVAAKTRAQVEHALRRLVDKYRRALGRADEVNLRRLAAARARLAPLGVPQERIHSLAGYAARHGAQRFVQAVLERVVPWDGTLQELRL